MLDQNRATYLLWSWMTLIGSLVDLSASSVMMVGSRYYYDVTYMLWNRKFQVMDTSKKQGISMRPQKSIIPIH